MHEVRIGKTEADQRLDKFLRRYLPGAGSGFLYRMLRKKNIVLNGRKADGREHLREGDRIVIFFSEETLRKFMTDAEKKISASCPPLTRDQILYEDADLIVMQKPAGILSQQERAGGCSMNERMNAYLRESGFLNDQTEFLYRPGVLNRLDRNTSGIIAGAKNFRAARILSELIRKHALKKTYLALAAGEIEKPVILEDCISFDEQKKRAVISHSGGVGWKPVRTGIRPVRAFRSGGFVFTLLEVDLYTGRKHQIRAHLAAYGHPVAGDVKYGREAENRYLRRFSGLSRQFLHAWKIEIPPDCGLSEQAAGRTFTSGLPGDLTRTLERMDAEKPDMTGEKHGRRN